MNKITIITLLSFAASSMSMMADNVYVQASPDGLTPHEALREAREMRRLHKVGVNDTLFIHLADGIYRMDETLMIRPEDSGTPTSPTVFIADHAGKAILSGAKELQMTKVNTSVSKSNTFMYSASPIVGRRPIDVRQLWQGDTKLPHASLVPLSEMLPLVNFDKENREITIARKDVEPILAMGKEELRNLEMIVHQRWAIAILRVKDYRVEGENVIFTFENPESRLEFEHPWPQPIINEDRGDGKLVTSSYNLLGGASLLKPGTWYQDNATGEIIYNAKENEQMPKVNVPVLHTLVEVSGSLERPVHDVIFNGVAFEHAAWTRPSELGHVTLQGGMYLLDAYKLQIPGLPEKAYLENQAWIERPEAAVSVRGGQHIDFNACVFSHLGATGLDYVWADSACRVTDCQFEDIGGTALALGAFPDGGFETHVPFRPVNLRELCSDILIKGNKIDNVTNEDWGCVGIGAGYVADVTISDNEVSNLNYSGICVGWGWTPLNSGMRNNHIVNNYVHDFAKMLYDAGGIYTLSYQPGSSIENNIIDRLAPPTYATNLRGFYIYLDEATDGYMIRNNWCPEEKFGDNRPGPDVHWVNNGPKAEVNIGNTFLY